MQTQQHEQHNAAPGPFYTFFVNDREFHVEKPTITGGEIMDLAGIPRNEGLVLILEDGTQSTVGVGEEIELKPGRRFKKAPRFNRG
jgi:Multiubiquitin